MDQRPSAFDLRPYQMAARGRIDEMLARYRSTLLVLPTGTGKTLVFAADALDEALRGGRTLILVHRDELLHQARRKCEAVGLSCSVEQGKFRASLNARAVAASVQTLSRAARLQRFPRDHFTRIVVDEAHHAPAAGYRAVLDYFHTAKILGVTATPKRADGVGLDAVFESVAYAYELRDAIADGWLVPIVARRVVLEGVDLSAIKSRAGDLAQDELAAAMAEARALRGTVDALLTMAGDRETVVFSVDVAHAEALAAELNRRRQDCARAVSGDSADRDRLLAAFERGKFQFLVNCALLTEGWDCPIVRCVAIVRPMKSLTLFTQMLGRGTRLLGATYAESCARGKRDVLLLAFGAHAGKHRLIGPVDVLQGDIPDDLRTELDRLLGSEPRRIEEVLAEATDTIARQRVDTAAAARVRWHAEHVDPFIGEPQSQLGEIRPGWNEVLATPAQRAALAKFGLEDPPAALTQADASRLLGRLVARAKDGLCSLPMARRLATYGIETRTLTAARARALFGLLRTRGWPISAGALLGQPEAGEEYKRRVRESRARKAEERRLKETTPLERARERYRSAMTGAPCPEWAAPAGDSDNTDDDHHDTEETTTHGEI